jgi:FKBP-type peptidyl-prolyl cis-trans isomerase (trigger factor)
MRAIFRDLFNAVIDNVSRVEPAELNEEFFQNLFGDEEIKDEEAARAKMKEESEKFFDKQAEALLFREVQDHLMDQFELPLPDDFLKRWLLSTNENLNKEDLDADYPNFADNLRWTLIKNKLAKKYEIKIEEEDIRKVMRDQVMRYFAGSQFGNDNSIIENMVDRLMQDQNRSIRCRKKCSPTSCSMPLSPKSTRRRKRFPWMNSTRSHRKPERKPWLQPPNQKTPLEKRNDLHRAKRPIDGRLALILSQYF